NTIATNMFYAWYLPFYHYSIIHGDPHLGNYTIRDNGDINLMDFGCIRIFTPSFTQGVIDLYYALLNNDQDLAIRAYETWGFQNISKDLISILNRWAKFLYGPLLEDKVQFLDESNSSIAGQKIAGEIHQELRNIGGVAPPPEFVFMDRAAVGLGSVFMHLKAKLNWYQLFHEMIDGFDEKIVGQRQEELIKKCDL
ncbi:MAG: AarF/ABC1/UbiB kinase family protein, partial [Alphaproteobacteria bacterium]|nr:AarF/ABC1/UbiB kinase family protein [Alphaproteobacteria bacterium]